MCCLSSCNKQLTHTITIFIEGAGTQGETTLKDTDFRPASVLKDQSPPAHTNTAAASTHKHKESTSTATAQLKPKEGTASSSSHQAAKNSTTASASKGGPITRESLPSTALRCVSLSFLLRFTDHYQLWHHLTRDVVSEVIAPLSKEQQCVWSDLDPAVSLLESSDIAPPQIFVSHAWTNSWGLLVLGVQAYAKFHKVNAKKLICWIDVFVINQHNYMQELKQLDRVIEVCANFIQIVDSEHAVPLGRVWCLYEVMARLKYKKNGGLTVTVASITPPEETVSTTSDGGNNSSSHSGSSTNTSTNITITTTTTTTTTSTTAPNAATAPVTTTAPARPHLLPATHSRIQAVLQQVDMEQAQASYPEDVEKILQLVRTQIRGGFATVNAQVREALMHNAMLNIFEGAVGAGAAGGAGKGKSANKGGKKEKHKTGGKNSSRGGKRVFVAVVSSSVFRIIIYKAPHTSITSKVF